MTLEGKEHISVNKSRWWCDLNWELVSFVRLADFHMLVCADVHFDLISFVDFSVCSRPMDVQRENSS